MNYVVILKYQDYQYTVQSWECGVNVVGLRGNPNDFLISTKEDPRALLELAKQ
jgi:hypothetical protein